jgi:hypothetical protein
MGKFVKKTAEQKLADAMKELQETNPALYAALSGALTGAKADQKLDSNLAKEAENAWERQRKEPHFWIELQMLDSDTDDVQFIGAAGVNYWIRKSVQVPVPQSVLEVLKGTRGTKWVTVIDEDTGRERMKEVPYNRIPYMLHGPVSLAEVAAWKKENGTMTQKPGSSLRRSRAAEVEEARA